MSKGTKKSRHNINLDPSVWLILNEIKRLTGESISQILEKATWEYLKVKGFNRAYFKLMLASEPCSDEENEELTKILDSLTEKDLEIARTQEIDL